MHWGLMTSLMARVFQKPAQTWQIRHRVLERPVLSLASLHSIGHLACMVPHLHICGAALGILRREITALQPWHR